MSLFRPMSVQCPDCDTLVTMQAVGSVNADRRPDLRADIMENRFQDVACDKCGAEFRLEPEMNYLDVGRRQWINALPARQMPDFLDHEDETARMFDDSYGANAPEAAQELGRILDRRVVFGWPALREKLLARELGLDDVALECLKMEVIRRIPSARIAPGLELRLIGAGDEALDLVWIHSDTEDVTERLSVPRPLYDEIVEKAEAWTPLRDQIGAGAFVDMQRLYMGMGRAAG